MFFLHLCSSHCQDIIADITSDSLSDEVHAIVDRAFSRSDKEVEQSLLAVAPCNGVPPLHDNLHKVIM